MSLNGFKIWLDELDKEMPQGPNIWDSGSNADDAYGLHGVRSKNAMSQSKGLTVDFDPEKSFFCGKDKKGKKRRKT